jgi:preprotein translocase subunit SecD
MEARKLMKEWRIWVLITALVISTALLIPWNSSTLFFDTSGDEIGFKTNLDDRKSIEFSGGARLLLEMETNATGTDLKQLADETRNTLEIRLSNSNIPDTSVRTIDIGNSNWRIQVESATDKPERLRSIVEREGSFETRMPLPVSNEKSFELGDYTYNFKRENSTVEVTGSENNFSRIIEPGKRFSVSDNGIGDYNTSFVYTEFNETTSTAEIEPVMYTGEEIESVVESDSQITGQGTSFEFRFPVIISQKAAQNRLEISQNYGDRAYRGPGSQRYLTLDSGEFARSGLYVDGNRESGLLMASVFADTAETRSTISGPGETREDAVEARDEMISILKSGSLEAPVKVVSSSTLSSSLGSQFMSAAVLSIIGALVAVGVLVFIRYKDPRVVLPLVLTGASEVYILLGAYFTTVGTLSLSAVAGIIAAVGTGVDDQIIITDESGKQDLGGWQKKMKRAFFVIFTSAASTIGAMSPIIAPGAVSYLIGMAGAGLIGYTLYTRGTNKHYVGIGVFGVMVSAFTVSLGPSGAALSSIHEFAKTTILGILVGIAVTRPAYAKTLEFLKE